MNRTNLARRIMVAGTASLLVYLALVPGRGTPGSSAMTEAAQLMRNATNIVSARRAELRIPEDPLLDPNGTGLIGAETGELLTTVGDLEAKRTSTNPNMAALIVTLLHESGVSRGDTIGVACSGSFPALMVASLAAARAADVRPVAILSLGASSYGATGAQFSLLDIYTALMDGKVCGEPPAAVSFGGEKDQGLDFEPAVREALVRQIERRGIPFIREPDLQKNLALRIAAYEASGRRIAALVNCGGSYSSLGTSASVLRLKPGLTSDVEIPPPAERGLVQEMAARRIPVIHLLHIKGLALRYGLPWDPVPLPEPGTFAPPGPQRRGTYFWLVSIPYLALIVVLALWPGIRRRGDTDFN